MEQLNVEIKETDEEQCSICGTRWVKTWDDNVTSGGSAVGVWVPIHVIDVIHKEGCLTLKANELKLLQKIADAIGV